jgi:rod shape-determining protein MreC
MEAFLSRYRNISVLLLLLVGQLLLLAWQVKAGDDARLLRVWAVTAITPLARASEWVRGGAGGFLSEYVTLRDVRDENRRLKDQIGKLRLANQYLKAELEMAERARALALFRDQTPSKTIGARVIATGTGLNSRAVFVDRGSVDGVKKGMAVIVPEGIVGKVVAAYPTASQVMLATGQSFAAGVISQKGRVRGTLKGVGSSTCVIEHIDNEDKVSVGEWFYTTGDDRIFPRGLPAGVVKSVKDGRGGKEVILDPSGLQRGVDEVLIVVEGVHGLIPDPPPPPASDIQILPAPPADAAEQSSSATPSGTATDADRLMDRYRRVGEQQGHSFGSNPGRPPDFNRVPAPAPQPGAAPPPGAQSGSTATPAPAAESPAAAPRGPAAPRPSGTGGAPRP